MQWHRDMLRGFRDNAAYEGGRYLILAILAAVWPTISGILHVFWDKPWYWKLNGALIALTAVLFIIALWKLVRIGKSQRILYEGRKSMPFVEAPIMPIVPATDLSQPKKLKEKSARPTDDVENRKLAALKDRRTNLLAKIRRLEAKPESTESKYHDIAGAIQHTHRHLNEVNEAIKRSEKQSATFPRVTYEETGQIIDIFRDAPRVKVAITSLSAKAGEEFRTVMEQAGWFCKALQDAGVSATGSFWETLGSLPDGTNIWWKKTAQNNAMVERIIRAAVIKGLHPTEVQRAVSAGDCEIELMIGRNPT